MPATPKEEVQASARLKDHTPAKQVKDPLDASPSESIKTKKRKRGGRSGTKSRRTSSSMETISQASINSKTPNKPHKRSPNKEPKRDNSTTKSTLSHGKQQPASPGRTQRELSPKLSSNQKAAKEDTASTKPGNPLKLPDLPSSEFIVPGGLELSLFNHASDEKETPHEPVSDHMSEEYHEISAMYTPISLAVLQYDQRIRSRHGGKCETWLARQMYHELNNISTQIDHIMGNIRIMLEKGRVRENFEDEESASFKGGPENPFELSDGDDNALFVRSDERACSGELHGLSGDE
ncbi:hypothetical protein N7516_003037 [Penicillium verrucosum]|uniref:uncharacterized protein n=1 Tax=Penicillium verrucosum TaxID=60171 RepID=UPI0025450658|nr:uncharacterized protein N7516_003037 [Penicillium verrucosum]KAJ5942869.1 hypothetical protein N7516_003037 [Penicillium verrucosum]